MIPQSNTHPIITWALNRTKKENKNVINCFVGQTGSGKSYSCMRFLEACDPNFNIDRVAFKALEFLRLINSVVEKIKSGELPQGTAVMWDEIGAEHNAREFMSTTNKIMNYIFQTCRHYNLIIGMTSPILSFIDTNTRKLFHIVSVTEYIDQSKGFCRVKCYIIQTNPVSGKSYNKFKRVVRNGGTKKVTGMQLAKPSSSLVQAYEDKKSQYTQTSYKEYEEKLLNKENKNKVSQFQQIKEAYLKQGDDVKAISQLLPHIDPSTLIKRLSEVKRFITPP